MLRDLTIINSTIDNEATISGVQIDTLSELRAILNENKIAYSNMLMYEGGCTEPLVFDHQRLSGNQHIYVFMFPDKTNSGAV